MNQPLGRSLGDLMPPDPGGDPGKDPSGSGVGRILREERERRGKPFGEKSSPFVTRERKAGRRLLEEVPSWIFYQGYVVLLALALWLYLAGTAPLETSAVLEILGLVAAAALLGVVPWLRNVLRNQRIAVMHPVPAWGVLANGGAANRRLLVHLRRPFFVVLVTRTAWDHLRVRPYWLDTPPNMSRATTERLLDEARDFFRKWEKEGAPEPEAPAQAPPPPPSPAER